MSSIESAASRTRAGRLSLRFEMKTLATLYHTLHSLSKSNSNGENNVYDHCRVCAFVFVNKKRKRNLDGEFLTKFEEVYNRNVRADDGLPRAVCDTCHYRVETMWKKSSVVFPSIIFRRGDIPFPLYHLVKSMRRQLPK